MNLSFVNPWVLGMAAPLGHLRTVVGLFARAALVVALAASAAAAGAQTSLTLYGGARGGGDFEDAVGNGNTFKLKSGAAASASVDWLLDDGRVAQVFYSFQRSALPGKAFGQPADVSVNISYLHSAAASSSMAMRGAAAATSSAGSAPPSSRPGSAGCPTRCARRPMSASAGTGRWRATSPCAPSCAATGPWSTRAASSSAPAAASSRFARTRWCRPKPWSACRSDSERAGAPIDERMRMDILESFHHRQLARPRVLRCIQPGRGARLARHHRDGAGGPGRTWGAFTRGPWARIRCGAISWRFRRPTSPTS